MQSVVHSIVPTLLDEPMPPWAKFNWSPKVQQDIYKSWGSYYTRRRREITSLHYFDKALKLEPFDFMTRYHRSQLKRKLAQPEGALEDCRAAAALAPAMRNGEQSAPINLEICDALYDLSKFEDSLVEIHDNIRYFIGNKTKTFKKRLVVVNENINDCVGDALGPFILQHDNIMHQVQALSKEKSRIETRPLWKVLKADGKCDVLSVLEPEVQLLSPIEIARRKRSFDLFNQNYLDRSWIDVLFLQNLKQNEAVLLEQTPESSEYLRKLLSTQDDVLKKFRKMMQSRSPMYYLRYNKISDFERLQRCQQDYLYRVQYQTRRNMITVLRTIRKLRQEKKLERLTSYVENVMGNYFTLKTYRVMPWKFEFKAEVYNTLALAYTEQYVVPPQFSPSDSNSLKKLLRLPLNKTNEYTTFKFGDRSTHQDVDETIAQNIKKYIGRLEHRLFFAKYSITHCYLLHQIAHAHFKQNRFDESCYIARRAIAESKKCKSYIWCFLSYLLMCKSHATLLKIERGREVLRSALLYANKLKSPKLVHFVETCLLCTENELVLKKAGMSTNTSIVSTRHHSKETLEEN